MEYQCAFMVPHSYSYPILKGMRQSAIMCPGDHAYSMMIKGTGNVKNVQSCARKGGNMKLCEHMPKFKK